MQGAARHGNFGGDADILCKNRLVVSSGHSMRRLAATAVGLALAVTACGPVASDAPPAASLPPPAKAFGKATAPPAWQPGDRWLFEWTSGSESGTKSAEVLETHSLGGIRYYVVRTGDSEHYYSPELHWAFASRDSKVQARMVPPQPWFVWPLEPGRRWIHRGSFEDGRGPTSFVDTFRALGVETVEVPAGRFQALKVRRDGERGDFDEYWYAPEVRWYVRWIGRRADVQFEERLRSYDSAPRRSGGGNPPASGSGPTSR